MRTTATGCEMTVCSDYESHYFDGRRLPGPKKKKERKRGFEENTVSLVLNALNFIRPELAQKHKRAVIDVPCSCWTQLHQDIWLTCCSMIKIYTVFPI